MAKLEEIPVSKYRDEQTEEKAGNREVPGRIVLPPSCAVPSFLCGLEGAA